MNTRKLFTGGEIGITNNEINLMPEANREGLHGINEGIGSGANMIISGVDAIINAGVSVVVQEGFVYLNGEMLKVDSQTVLKSVASDLYEFQKVTTISVDGERNYRDGTTHNVYEKNRAVPTNVAAITGLSVTGSTVIDILKGFIQVQTDYNQADTNAPDYLKNKPNILNTLIQGKINGIEIGASTSMTVEGGFTSAVNLNASLSELRIRVNFPSIGTTNYHPLITLESKSVDWKEDNDVFCMVKNLTTTSFELLFREVTSFTQNITVLATIIPF